MTNLPTLIKQYQDSLCTARPNIFSRTQKGALTLNEAVLTDGRLDQEKIRMELKKAEAEIAKNSELN